MRLGSKLLVIRPDRKEGQYVGYVLALGQTTRPRCAFCSSRIETSYRNRDRLRNGAGSTREYPSGNCSRERLNTMLLWAETFVCCNNDLKAIEESYST